MYDVHCYFFDVIGNSANSLPITVYTLQLFRTQYAVSTLLVKTEYDSASSKTRCLRTAVIEGTLALQSGTNKGEL